MQVQEELRTALEATNSALQDIISLTTAPKKEPSITDVPAAAHPPRPAHHSTANNNNARIHPRSLYSDSEPDFASLAQEYPSLQPYLLPIKQQQQQQSPPPSTNSNNNSLERRTIDFKNPSACRELTKILLKKDFGVIWDLPDGHLVPSVTNRLNYILWVEDLLNLSSPMEFNYNHNTIKSGNYNNNSSTRSTNTNTTPLIPIKGLDIGCGASCVYPLLGASLLKWHFVGIDVTSEAIEWARKNVEMNQELKKLIEVRKVEMQPEQKKFFSSESGGGGCLKFKNDVLVDEGVEVSRRKRGILASAFKEKEVEDNSKKEFFTFTMCNPPFFENFDHANSNPSTAFGGTQVESSYPGGEESFLRNIFEDSLLLKDRVHWFTTMVGKKVTLKALKKWLHAEPSVRVVRTTEFFQGQTSRWGVAWSFSADPSIALKPIDRGRGGGGGEGRSGGGIKRLADGQEEREEEGRLSLPRQQHQLKKRKITGRSVSIHLALKDAHAALKLLEHIKVCLEGSRAVKCSLDNSQYQLTARPQTENFQGVSSTATTSAATAFTVQLLAQQPKRYVLAIALTKSNNAASATSNNAATMAWFSGVVAEIEAAVISHDAVQIIS
jgi:23S rRNA (adenine1618-N6)-methyltransferase